MKSKQKVISVICIIIAIVIIAAAALYYFVFRGSGQSTGSQVAYVDPVSVIAGLGSGNGNQNRFSGVVESRKQQR